MKRPICIIGGGIIGLLCARELVEAGEKVRVLDRGEAGKESSWAGGGILSPLYPWRYPDSITQLARWSQSAYPVLVKELLQETGVDVEWVRSGLLILEANDIEQAVNWASKFAISAKTVDSQDIDDIQEGLAASVGDAFWMPEIAQVRNPRLLAALKSDLRKKGVEFLENEAVVGFRFENDRFVGIETNKTKLDTDRCIIAAGAWSRELCAELGLELAVKPVRGQMLLYRARPDLLQRIVLKDNRYLIPRRDGRILVGSTLEDVGFDKTTTQAAADELHEVALSLLPGLAEANIEVQWAGLRPGSPEGVPYIGQHPEIAGLYVCTGHFRNGFVTGPGSARLMADLILGREPALEQHPYRIDRAGNGA